MNLFKIVIAPEVICENQDFPDGLIPSYTNKK